MFFDAMSCIIQQRELRMQRGEYTAYINVYSEMLTVDEASEPFVTHSLIAPQTICIVFLPVFQLRWEKGRVQKKLGTI